LPDDFDAIAKLLHVDRSTLLARLNVPDESAAKYLALRPHSARNGKPE
jgi:hypothetical protein